MHSMTTWKRRAADLKAVIHALYLASRGPHVPWYAKLAAGAVVAYALSPIDLIPDFIPVVGYLDDLVILPLGIMLVLKLIPSPVWENCKLRARQQGAGVAGGPRRWVAAGVIVGIWLLAVALSLSLAWRLSGSAS